MTFPFQLIPRLNQRNMSGDDKKEAKSSVQINLQMRDIIVLVAFLLGIPVGGFTLYASNADNSNALTRQAVSAEADTLGRYLAGMTQVLEALTDATKTNTQMIQLQNREHIDRMDSLYGLTMDFARNMDGYFNGRLDQMKDD